MFKKVLFCTDFSDNSHHAFPYALNLAVTYHARLLILHVVVEQPYFDWSTPEGAQELIDQQRRWVEQQAKTYYLSKMGEFEDYEILSREAGEGVAFHEIIQAAKEQSVDLILMGTHGRSGLDHLILGSTAENVVRKSPCPVMVVRLPARKSDDLPVRHIGERPDDRARAGDTR